jgi:dUTP pyrophosphatase
MKVKIKKLKPQANLPEYQTEQAAAMDLHACIDAPMEVAPMERFMVPTGIAVELPEGYEAQVRARSGLSIKKGLSLINGIGTIDADFRGEINVLMINLSQEKVTIDPNMRTAQLVLSRFEKIEWEESQELTKTERGDGGYGSTGA